MIHAVAVECCEHCGRVPLNARERARACVKCGREFQRVHRADHPLGPDQPWVPRLRGRVLWRVRRDEANR